MIVFTEWIRDDLDKVSFNIIFSISEVESMLADYNSESQSSPSEATARDFMRSVLDSLKAKMQEHG
jgi:hypothetical protein